MSKFLVCERCGARVKARVDGLCESCRPPRISVWRFEDAPEEYRRLGEPDDVDWLAFVPEALADEYIGWLESGTSFGCYRVDTYDVPGGVVYIGYHG